MNRLVSRSAVSVVWVVVSVAMLSACGARASEPAPERRATSGDDEARASEAAPRASSGNAILDAHNARRAAHCAPALAWSDALAAQAQGWADHLAGSGCQLEHSDSSYGENLAAGTSGMLSPEDVVEMWYAERESYAFDEGGFSMDTGHFTQLVWAGSSSLGCAMARCSDLDVWVCNYDPPGNVEGEYQTNVHPTPCP